MKQYCHICSKEADEYYRVNGANMIFCGDDCYEAYMSNADDVPDDHHHPYIDDYEAIRRIYFYWYDNWETEILERGKNFQYSIDIVQDMIDKDLQPYFSYFMAEGDDGVFAYEIYQYYLKILALQKEIALWRPEKELYYYLSFSAYDDADSTEKLLEVVCKDTSPETKSQLLQLLKDHEHPYDTNAFYFDTKEELDEVIEALQPLYEASEDFYAYTDEAYLCEGHCYDIDPPDGWNQDDQDGWFFCWSCESYFPGFFSKEELPKVIEEYAAKDYVGCYLSLKIKRSCRFHDVDLPDWADVEPIY